MINCTSTTESIILKAPETVNIPIAEYKSLIRSEQLAELTKRVLNRKDKYSTWEYLDVLYSSDTEYEERKHKEAEFRKRKEAEEIANNAAKAVANTQNKEETKSEPESE